mgnify:CR=1 FL=1
MDLEFRLKAAFKTSGDPTPAVDAIQEFLEGEAPKVLAKGAPEGEEAKIKSWNVKDNRIDIEIVSGRYVRSHDAIIRLRKPLAGKSLSFGLPVRQSHRKLQSAPGCTNTRTIGRGSKDD